jgi:phosphoribosylformylglycinamidine cyclo-ligase
VYNQDMNTYSESGVDTGIEEQAAIILFNAAKRTWGNRSLRLGEVIAPFDDFSGLRAIDAGQLPAGTLLNLGFDGVGTKAEFAELAGRYDTLAYDLFAMVCDDAVIRGGEPVLVGSILDVNTLGTDESRLPSITQLAEGYTLAAEAAGVAIVNGELAQLGDRLGKSQNLSLSWGAAVLWFAAKERLLTGTKVRPGDTIIGLGEPGLRSNGITLVRRVLEQAYGAAWPTQELNGTPLIDLALTPSIIYAKAIIDMFGGWSLDQAPKARLHAAAHITGSGLPGKLGRALKPSGFGASIDSPMPVPELMLHCQKVGQITDHEAYKTWHMGQGMVLITPEPHAVLAIARGHHLEASVIGTVTASPRVRIASRGYYSDAASWLDYPLGQ